MIYRACYLLFKTATTLRFPGSKISLRNSFQRGNYEPFVSDIDMTILLDGNVSCSEARRLCQWSRQWKKAVPILGEINIYQPQIMKLLSRSINHYELQRDPTLLKKMNITDFNKSNSEKLAFLIRCLESDCRTLQTSNSRRRRKWVAHLRDVMGKSLSEDPTWQLILQQILQLVPVEERESFISQLTRFLVAKIAQQDIYQFENEIETLDWLISVFPNHYGYSNRRFPSLSPFQRQVLLQQLRWEIFGSLTQHYNFPRNLFVENLKNFHTMLSKINWAKEENVQVLELQNDLKEAMELIILLESNSKLSEQVF